MILGNTFINGGTAMTVLGTSKNLNFSNNFVSTVRYHGLYALSGVFQDCVISDNIIRDVGLSGGTSCGIQLSTGTGCVISGNRIQDGQATKTMTYGIRLNSGANNNFVHGNYITDAITSSILDEGTGNTLSDNK
jgi:hypothetical protein